MNKEIEEIVNVKLINPDSADEIWTTLKSLGMSDVEDYLKILNCNMYETISRGTSHKMSFKELMLVFDPLNELLKGNLSKFAFRIERSEVIRIQIRYMNENNLCPTLSNEEKLFFAWCVYLMTCTNRFIDGNILYGITEFTSYEKIIDLYESDRKDLPDLFDLADHRIKTGEYGYSAENPICTTSIGYAMRLLNRFMYKNEEVTIMQRNTIKPSNTDHLIDKYDLSTRSGSHISVYVDPYCIENSNLLPEGFSLFE